MPRRQKMGYTIGAVSLIGFVILFADITQLVNALQRTEFRYLYAVTLLFIIFNIFNGYITNKLILEKFKAHLTCQEWVGLSFINTLANLIFPLKSGTLIKAIYLKKHYRLDISKSAAILVFSSYVSVMTLMIISSGLLIYLLYYANQTSILWLQTLPTTFVHWLAGLTLLSAIVATVFLVICLNLPSSRIQPFSKLPKRIHAILSLLIDSTLILAKSPLLALGIALSAVVNLFINIAILFLTFSSMGLLTDIFGLTIVNLLNSITFFISITPGNLALQEISLSLSSLVMDLTLEEGLAAATLIRACSTLVAVIGGGYFYHTLGITPFKSDKL